VPAPKSTWTILDVLRWTTGRFTERGLASPRLDAELLAAHALSLSRIQLYAQFDRPLDADELAGFRDLVKRRQGGEPIAYITGRKEFWSLELTVDARVLIPRPDTETLIDEALERLPIELAARVADVGTGSGAIALAIAKARPQAKLFATDISDDALSVARLNATQLGLVVEFVQGALAEPLRPHAPFDLIAANLPYIPSAEIPGLSAEVRSEPVLALDGGADGLDLVRQLVQAAPSLLAPGGSLLLEIGAGQAPATAVICAEAGFVDIMARRDLAGIERVVAARFPVSP
jgi:release factor glutamine methyltransferase